MPSVLFGMPVGTYATISPRTWMWLSNEMASLNSIGVRTNVFTIRDVPVDRAREIIIESALRDNYDYVFFIDSDVVPQPGVVSMALRLRLPFVCIPYPLKIGVLSVYLFDERNRIVRPVEPQTLKQLMSNRWGMFVDACGLGAALIDTYIFKKMPKPWFRFAREEYVHVQTLDKITVEYNEDVYFCLEVKRRLGIQPYVLPMPAHHELLPGLSLDPLDPTRVVIPMERLDFVPLYEQMKRQEQQSQ